MENASMSYVPGCTAVLLVDPYNDFLSEGGKLAARAKPIADAVGAVAHMKQIVAAARQAGVRIFYVPHHRARADDFTGWRHPTPYALGGHRLQVFAQGSWGGQWHPDFEPRADDVMIKEHWASSGFANTDLDLQLKQHGISHLIAIGMLANTCIETTAKFASELGYHVTLVRDATAAFSPEAMSAAHQINGPTYAHLILDTEQVLARLPA